MKIVKKFHKYLLFGLGYKLHIFLLLLIISLFTELLFAIDSALSSL